MKQRRKKYYFHQNKSTALKNLFALVLVFSSLVIQAQPTSISGRVYDQETNEPLPFVNITINHSKVGTAADIDGRFHLSANVPITSVKFSFVGYESFIMPITATTPVPVEVYMKESSTQLQEALVIAGENPAHRIIKNAVKNRKFNRPENLESFSYTSYNKLVVTLQEDSTLNPTNTEALMDAYEVDADSTMIKLNQFIERQHLFLMETVSERKYMKPNKDNDVVVANRVSGLEDPSFVILANQLQSFSFYSDFISVLSLDYLNPISKGSTKKYRFMLRDTTFKDADTTFLISFEPNSGTNFRGLKGLLFINSDGWAIQNVKAEPAEEQEDLKVIIQQRYEQFEGGSWFPVQLNTDFYFTNLQMNAIMPVGLGRSYLSDIKINPALDKKAFLPVALKVNTDATQKQDGYWNAYRVDSLTQKERRTYEVVDSIGEELNFEQKLKWIEALANGRIRWKIFDFPLEHLMRYNIYEGFRLGAGAETNPVFSEWFKVGGYFGYGFKDHVLKYGYFGEARLHNNTNLKIGGGYRFDIFESGGDQWIDEPVKSIISGGNTRLLWIQRFDEMSEAFGYITWHPKPNLHTKLEVSRQNRIVRGADYGYLTTNNEGGAIWQNGFVASLVQASVVYTPNDEYMEDKYGRRPIKQTYPTMAVQYTQGIAGFLDGTLDFKRLDAKIRHDIKTKELGITSIEVGGGKVFGDVPYNYLYTGRSNLPDKSSNSSPIYIADPSSFETMVNNEFLNDEYVHFFFRQNLQSRLLKVQNWAPDIELLFRALWGRLQNPQLHRGINFKDASQGFYETGLEINKIFSSFGVGAYYRFGPYQLPDAADNWSIKLSYRVTFFN